MSEPIRLAILPVEEPLAAPGDRSAPGTFAWYEEFLQSWAVKECQAARIKQRDYCMPDDIAAQLRRMAQRAGISLWQAWLAGAARHMDMLAPDTPREIATKRLADLYGYICLGLALQTLNCTSSTSRPPDT